MSNESVTPEQSPPTLSPAGPILPLIQRMTPIAFAVLVLGVVFFLYQIVGGVATYFLFKGDISEGNVQGVRIATLVGQVLFLLIPTIMLARARRPGNANFFRVRAPHPGQLALTIIAIFALQQILQEYMLLQDLIPLPQPVAKWVEYLKELFEQTYKVLVSAHSPGEFLFVVAVVALTPAVCEELLFRGLIQRTFEEALPGGQAAIVTGVIFGAYHLNPFSIVPLVVLGAFFGFIVYRAGNLTLGIIAHFFNNFLASLAVYLRWDDNFLAVAPSGQPTPALLGANFLLFAMVFVAATYYFIRVTRPGVPPIAT